jgi:hypothetical protein
LPTPGAGNVAHDDRTGSKNKAFRSAQEARTSRSTSRALIGTAIGGTSWEAIRGSQGRAATLGAEVITKHCRCIEAEPTLSDCAAFVYRIAMPIAGIREYL